MLSNEDYSAAVAKQHTLNKLFNRNIEDETKKKSLNTPTLNSNHKNFELRLQKR